jgi:hypothetical protein
MIVVKGDAGAGVGAAGTRTVTILLCYRTRCHDGMTCGRCYYSYDGIVMLLLISFWSAVVML